MDANTPPLPFDELEPVRRRVLIIRSVVVSLAILSLLVGAYFVLPERAPDDAGLVARLVVAVMVIVLAVVAGARVVATAQYPILGLGPALSGVGGVALIGFASVYLLVSSNDPAAFSEPLDHVDALYFTITTTTTVGFGDIVPRTGTARVVVMFHMAANVTILGLGVRALVHSARRRVDGG